MFAFAKSAVVKLGAGWLDERAARGGAGAMKSYAFS